jgi:hypothetical protein
VRAEKMKIEQKKASITVDVAWIAVKIIWGIYCLGYSFLGIRAIGISHFPFCFVFFFWFAAGFLFCVLQHKIQYLSWAIITHLFLTSLFIVPSAPFYPYFQLLENPIIFIFDVLVGVRPGLWWKR